MRVDAEVVLFLGAGASLPLPAGSPLFRHVRDACAKRARVNVRRWKPKDPRQVLLEHVIPEVFLKLLADAGYELGDALAQAVQGSPGGSPNAVHVAAGEVLAAGGAVWTTNWDCWIERAASGNGEVRPAVYPVNPPPAEKPVFGKLHGSVDRPSSLLFATPHIMRPMREDWHEAIVSSCRGRRLFVVGYSGADIDLYPALAEGIAVAKGAYWFEGFGGTPLAEFPAAAYAQWRFGFDRVRTDPRALPEDGRWLVWCGAGSTASNPSNGLLAALGLDGDTSAVPGADEQFDLVDAKVRLVSQRGQSLGRQLLLAALVNERLGQRWRAAVRHGAVLLTGPARERRKSARSLGNLVLLRAQPFRRAAVRAYERLSRTPERAEFMVLQTGGVEHDAALAADVAAGATEVSIDRGLNLAMSGRWSGDLRIAERIARAQFERALAQDLSSTERDWPERVARAAFEIAQVLVWQGRLLEADEVCRQAYMRVAGAKWTAWEFAIRGVVRFAHGDYSQADAHFAKGIDILHLEGFRSFTPPLFLGRAAAHRRLGETKAAAAFVADVERRPQKGPGTVAALVAEQAEQALMSGDREAAGRMWTAMSTTQLPLWKALARLRLAEEGFDADANANTARDGFAPIGCRWGEIRCRVLLGDLDQTKLRQLTADLGPIQTFQPGGRWLF